MFARNFQKYNDYIHMTMYSRNTSEDKKYYLTLYAILHSIIQTEKNNK